MKVCCTSNRVLTSSSINCDVLGDGRRRIFASGSDHHVIRSDLFVDGDGDDGGKNL
jgi:hypothetical protein